MDPDIKIGIIQLTSNDNLQDNCNQMDYYFNQCLKDGANFILSPEVSNFISTNSELKKKSIKFEKKHRQNRQGRLSIAESLRY